MTDSSFQRHSIDLAEPGKIIAAVPNLFGYQPVNSLVVIAPDIEAEDSTHLALRVDLPAPDDHSDLGGTLAKALAARYVENAVLIVIDGTDAGHHVLPHRELVSRCERRFADGGVRISHQLWASATHPGAGWRCYQHPDGGGAVPDVDTTTLTSQTVADARVRPRREDIAATLAPVDEDTLARRAALIPATHRRLSTDAPHKLHLLDQAIEAAAEGILPETDQAIITLTIALTDRLVLDACMWWPDSVHTEAAERLWAELTRTAPAPHRAEPACLLAVSTYQRGDGVLTAIALDIAEAADPQHSLATLLRKALNLAVHPDHLQRAGRRGRALARLEISGAQL